MRRRLIFTALSVLLVLVVAYVLAMSHLIRRHQAAETTRQIVIYTQNQISSGLRGGGVASIRPQQVAVSGVVPTATKGDYLVNGSFNHPSYGIVRFQMRCYNAGWDNWSSYGSPSFDKPVMYVKPPSPN